MQKYEIALLLAQKFGYTSYLEICTRTTGGTYAQVDKQQFTRRMRVMYDCPADFVDGEVIDLSTDSESGEDLYANILKSGEKFDLVFIDPFHSYEASLRDIVYALQLVKPQGMIVIHDCFPPNEDVATPEVIPGAWCGVTYAAFLDVVLFAKDISYCTVDSDFGCGIISKDDRFASIVDHHPDPELISQWSKLGIQEKYPFFEKNHTQLLRLIPPDDFRQRLFSSSFHTNLENIQTELNNIRNTITWKIHETIHNISFIRKGYLAIVMPFRKWRRTNG